MSTDVQIVVEAAHEADESLPILKRIERYRAFARTTADVGLAKHFHLCADDLAAVQARCEQRELDFNRRGAA